MKVFYAHKRAALDRQMDALVHGLYGLTPDEIKIVEGAAYEQYSVKQNKSERLVIVIGLR